MNLLSLLSMLGAQQGNPGQDPNNPLRQPVAPGPEPASAPSRALPNLMDMVHSAVGSGNIPGLNYQAPDPTGYLSAVQGRDLNAEHRTAMAPFIQAAIKQQQDQVRAQGFAMALAPVDGLVRQQRYGDAATAYRTAAQFAPDAARAQVLEKAAERYEEMGAQVDIAGHEARAREAFKTGGPDAIYKDPALVAGLARRPGGPAAFVKELAPTTDVTDNQIVTKPSPLFGGAPTVVPRVKMGTLDERTKDILAELGYTESTLKEHIEGGDPILRQMGEAAIRAARIKGDTRDAFKNMGVTGPIADIIAARPDRDQLAAWQTNGTPEQKAQVAQAVAQAREQVRKENLDELVKKAWAEGRVTQGLNESTLDKEMFGRGYDQRTGQAVPITEGMLRNPKLFAPYGGSVVVLDKDEAKQMRFQESEINPSLSAAKDLSQKILSRAQVLNLPQGVALDVHKWIGSADVAQFKEEMRKLVVAEARIEGGSVRIPVTMMRMLEGTLPTTYSTLQQAARLLNSFEAAAENRRRGFLQRRDFVPIPTEDGEYVKGTAEQVKSGQWEFKRTEGTKLSTGRSFKMPEIK